MIITGTRFISESFCVCVCIYILLTESPKWSASGMEQTNIRTLQLVPSVGTDLFSVSVFDYISKYTYFNNILLYSFSILLEAILFITYIMENYQTHVLSLQIVQPHLLQAEGESVCS